MLGLRQPEDWNKGQFSSNLCSLVTGDDKMGLA